MLNFLRRKSEDEKLLAAHLKADEIVYHGVKLADTAAGREMLALPDARRTAIATIAVRQWLADKTVTYTNRERLRGVISEMLRGAKELGGEDALPLVDAAGGLRRDDRYFTLFPFKPILGVVERLADQDRLPQELLDALRRWRTAIAPRELRAEEIRDAAEANAVLAGAGNDYLAPRVGRALETLERIRVVSATAGEQREAMQRIDELLRGPAATKFFVIEATDAVGSIVSSECSPGGRTSSDEWTALLRFASNLEASKPSKKWLTQAKAAAEKIAPDELAARLSHWFAHVGEKSQVERRGTYGQPVEVTLLNDGSANLLKGLAWVVSACGRDDLSAVLATLAEACFKKVSGHGPRNSKVGNAATGALAALGKVESAAQLARVRTKVKHASARATVEKAMQTLGAATGFTRQDLEELGVPTFDLDANGVRRVTVGDCAAELRAIGREVELQWFGPGGKLAKSVPTTVKDNHADALKQLKKTAKDASAMLTAQAMRIERLLMGERAWTVDEWRKRFLDHPLLSALARRLIWRIDQTLAIWHEGQLMDVNGSPVAAKDDARVTLWHPITSPAEEVHAWRMLLEKREIVQPFKQAFREIYILTDAERQTGEYSNRFAAHVLKQHQLNALCQSRGWRYRLQGNFDSFNAPTLELPEHGITAEFVVEGSGETSPAGIFLYVASDQVRFGQRLEQVPAVVFSEVMRDVDLFVGVSSVGNDPTWHDTGPQQMRTYWEGFAFGELGEMAKSRKEVIERLLPRLKIAPRCSLSEKFLIVRGELRTYKIHLGSGNILMEPNDQYLCIVPGTSKSPVTGRVFLPFEGDQTLSIILSKAFLLADDRNIKDLTIIRQIR